MLQRLRSIPDWIRQAMIYAGALASAKAISLLMIPVFTHYLPPEDFAKLDILQSLADILSIIIGLGLADTLYRYCGGAESEAARKKHASAILGLAVMTALVFGILLQLAAPVLHQLMPLEVDLWDLRLILISLSFSAVILVPLSWLRMENRPWAFFSASAGRGAFQAFLAFIFLSLGFAITGVLTAGLIACCSLVAFAFYSQWKKTGISFSLTENLKYGAYAGPLIFVGLFGFVLGSFDRWILADQGDLLSASHYALAVKFGLATAFLIQPYEMWWLPKRFAALKEENGHKTCARFAHIGIAIAFASAFCVSSFAPLAISWMTPSDYHGAIAYVGPLALLSALHMSNTMINLGIYAGTHTRLPMKIDGVAATLALIGYLTLIPVYGPWGAIGATFGALSLRFMATWYFAQKTKPLPLSGVMVMTIIACSAGLTFGLSMLEDPLDIAIVGALAILVALMGFTMKKLGLASFRMNRERQA